MISKHAYINEKFSVCLDLVGADVIFAQNWNFELKLSLDNAFMKKISIMSVIVHFFPKHSPKKPKTQSQNSNGCLKKVENRLRH